MGITVYANCTACCDTGVLTACCADTVPRTLFASLDGGAIFSCKILTGLTSTLTYNAGTGQWSGTYGVAPDDGTLTLSCVAGTWTLALTGNCQQNGAVTLSSGLCNPLQLVFDCTMQGCCDSVLEITITE